MVLACVELILDHLGQPWLKRCIQTLVRASAGIEIDYGSAHIRLLSGVHVENLLLLSPPGLRDVAPHLVRVGNLDVVWSLSSLLGDGARIERVALENVEVTIVEDEHGRTSLDGLGPKPDQGRAGSMPRSHRSITPLGAPPFGQVNLSRVGLTFVRTRNSEILDRLALRDLALCVNAHRVGHGWVLEARAGSPAAPLNLLLVRDGSATKAGTARLALWLDGQAEPASATATLDLRARDQTIAPLVPIREILHLEARAIFNAASTEVSVAQTRIADGAATLEAQLTLPAAPDAAPLLRQARGQLDLKRLLRTAPPGLVPIVGEGTLFWRARDVELARVPHLLPGGALTVEAEIVHFRLTLAKEVAVVDRGRWRIEAHPGPDGPLVRTSLELKDLRIASPRLHADDLRLQLRASRNPAGAWTGTANLDLGSLQLAGGNALAARGFHAHASVNRLSFNATSLLSAIGDLDFSGEIATLHARAPQGGATASNLSFRFHAPLVGGPPFSGRIEIPIRNLRILAPDTRLLASAPAEVAVQLTDVVPNIEDPGASRAIVRAVAHMGECDASIDATKRTDAVDFSLKANARELPLMRVLAGTPDPRRLTAVLSMSGRIEAISSANPTIRQQTELRLEGPALRRISARRLDLTVQSSGNLRQHRANIDLLLHRPDAADAWRITLSAELDRTSPSLAFRLIADGEPSASISGSLVLDRAHRTLRCDLDGHLAQLGPLSPFLSKLPVAGGFDWSRLDVALAVHGTVADIAPDSIDRPLSRLLSSDLPAANGTIEIRARDVRWQGHDRALEVPSGTCRVQLSTVGARHDLNGAIQLSQFHLLAGTHRIEATGIAARASASFAGDLVAGEADLTLQLSLRSMLQDLAAYPIGDLGLAVSAHRSADGLLRISNLRLENAAAKTSLALQGGVDLGVERHRLSLRGQLHQDFARVWSAPETFQGRGHLGAIFRAESSDLTVFRTQATLRLEDVHAHLPRANVSVESLDGEIPISADVAIEGRNVTLLPGSAINPYPLHRFADQHPLQTRSSFLSVGSITSPIASISQLAGNFKIEQNVISLSQLEMRIRGGRVTGDCMLDWNGEDSTLWAHVRATDVQSSHGEPFDGNAALVISAGERSIDGRIEVLRIGPRHLLDLLDLQDPLRVDPATNRIRHLLSFGYPDKVRAVFDHGFASLQVTFGGLARFFSVGDLRGIPTGPIVDKVLAPFSPGEDQ